MVETPITDYDQDYQLAAQLAQNWFNTDVSGSNTSLADYLYAGWYTKSNDNKSTVQLSPLMLVNSLNAAARMTTFWQSGWECSHQQRGSSRVAAIRKGERRSLCSFEYINESCPGRRAEPGEVLKVMSHTVSDRLLEGYWVGHSEQWVSSPGRILRVYWNIDNEGAALLVHTLFSTMPDNIAYSLKLLVEADGYLRTDTAVLYFHTRDIGVVMPAIYQTSRKLDGLLYTGIPRLTKPVTKGVSLAEEPRLKNQSFGSSRCQILASALQRAHAEGIQKQHALLAIIHQELNRAGINPEKPYKITRNTEQGTRYECTDKGCLS